MSDEKEQFRTAGTALVAVDPTDVHRGMPAVLADEAESARAYADASTAGSTQRAYASDWRIFTAWCENRDLCSIPADPSVVAVFVAAQADDGVKPSTLGRRAAAIGYFHRQAGFEPPQNMRGSQAIRDVLAGVRRVKGVKPDRKRAADAAMLMNMLAAITGDEPRDVRDRALLAIGMGGAFRRSELVALSLPDLEMTPEGLRITIAKSKTDQEGEGAIIAIPEGKVIKPKALLLHWIELAGFTEGPVFRKMTPQGRISPKPMSDRGVAIVAKARAAAAGYDPDAVAGHSLRSGFLTEAARRGASIFKMKEVSRHKSLDVLADYVRDAQLFEDHAGSGFL